MESKNAANEEPKDSGLEYWVKIIPLITSAVSGVLAFIPQTSNLFGPFDYSAETLLVICIIGIVFFAVRLAQVWPKPKKSAEVPLFPTRLVGIVIIVAAPLLGWLLWFTMLRLPPDKEEMVKREIAIGDTELRILNNPTKAREHYRNALLLAPRRGSIRAKVQDAEERMRQKGD